MRLTTLLPHLRGLRVLNAAVSDDEVTLDVEPIAANGTLLTEAGQGW